MLRRCTFKETTLCSWIRCATMWLRRPRVQVIRLAKDGSLAEVRNIRLRWRREAGYYIRLEGSDFQYPILEEAPWPDGIPRPGTQEAIDGAVGPEQWLEVVRGEGA